MNIRNAMTLCVVVSALLVTTACHDNDDVASAVPRKRDAQANSEQPVAEPEDGSRDESYQQEIQVQLIAPLNGSSSSARPVLTWSKIPNVAGYTVVAAYDSVCIDFTKDLPGDCLSCLWIHKHTDTTFSMQHYGPGTYYWRIAAVPREGDDAQNGWSKIWSFTIE